MKLFHLFFVFLVFTLQVLSDSSEERSNQSNMIKRERKTNGDLKHSKPHLYLQTTASCTPNNFALIKTWTEAMLLLVMSAMGLDQDPSLTFLLWRSLRGGGVRLWESVTFSDLHSHSSADRSDLPLQRANSSLTGVSTESGVTLQSKINTVSVFRATKLSLFLFS